MLLGHLPLLQNPDGVAEWVANAHVGSVEVLGGFLGEVGDAPLAQRVVHGARVVGDEHEAAQGALGDQLAQALSCGVVVEWGTGLLKRDFGGLLAGSPCVSR